MQVLWDCFNCRTPKNESSPRFKINPYCFSGLRVIACKTITFRPHCLRFKISTLLFNLAGLKPHWLWLEQVLAPSWPSFKLDLIRVIQRKFKSKLLNCKSSSLKPNCSVNPVQHILMLRRTGLGGRIF